MSNSLSTNIEKLMKSKNLTQQQIAAICGVKQPSVNQWLKTGSISKKNLMKLCAYFGLSPDDLLSGTASDNSPYPTRQIPLISWVQAGNWTEISDNQQGEYIPVDVTIPDTCYALTVNGNSMESSNGGKSIPDGAVVIVQPCDYLTVSDLNHRVVIAVHEGKATMKEYVMDGASAYLQPWNTALFDKIPVTQDTQIVGVVIRYQMKI